MLLKLPISSRVYKNVEKFKLVQKLELNTKSVSEVPFFLKKNCGQEIPKSFDYRSFNWTYPKNGRIH